MMKINYLTKLEKFQKSTFFLGNVTSSMQLSEVDLRRSKNTPPIFLTILLKTIRNITACPVVFLRLFLFTTPRVKQLYYPPLSPR